MPILIIKAVVISTLLALNVLGEPLKVFICAGQSNMHGIGADVSLLPEHLRGEQEHLFFNKKEWVALSPENLKRAGLGPETSFIAKMGEHLGEKIGVIKLAVGGADLAIVWDPEAEGSPEEPAAEGVEREKTGRRLYPTLQKQYQKAKKAKEIEVVGMIWMQGEADSKTEDYALAYKENLEAFMQKARKDFNAPDMPFIAGRVNPENPQKYAYVEDVRKAQESITLAGYAFIDCDHLEKLEDKVHYSIPGRVMLGEMFAEQMILMLEK